MSTFPDTTNSWTTTYTRFAAEAGPAWSVDTMTERDWALYRYLRTHTADWGTPLSRQAYKALTGGGRGRNAKRPAYKLYRKLIQTEHAAQAPNVVASVRGSD
jgi:hypothetical protein